VKVGRRLTSWIFCACLVAALPVMGSMNAAAASPAPTRSHAPVTSHATAASRLKPFLPETARARAASALSHVLTRASGGTVKLHSMGKDAPSGSAGHSANTHAVAPIVSPQTDTLASFPGASQAQDIAAHGASTQDVAPPDTDIAAGPTDIVDTVNSTIEVRSRAGALLASNDLTTFLSVRSGHDSSDPRIVYDSFAQRWFLTITEAAPFSCSTAPAPVLIAVSTSSNPLPFSSWIVYELPLVTHGTFLADQPGLGFSTNTVAVSWTDYDCTGHWLGADADILQRTDLELDTVGPKSDVPFNDPNGFAPQPVQSLGATGTQYLVTNDSDCAPSVCVNPFIEVDAFTGTPEGSGGVSVASSTPTMDPTLVDGTYFGTPPAQQNGTPTTINTDDDRFLNAVWQNGKIWTADGTECTPAGDSAPRSCLNYVEVTASATGVVNPTITQINNVGVVGSYLFYPAVSVDSAGNVFTTFDESSSSTFPTIMSATIAAGGSTLSAFQTVHTSTGFYNPDFACQSIASTNACRWGDYSGAAQDPSNPKDVWVVSEAEDGSTSSACNPVQANQCWSSDIADVTLASPSMSALTPASGPVAGGQTVTVSGLDFGTDTTATFNGSSITIHSLTPKSFTFVTPASATLAGGPVLVQATDALGTTAALTYTFVGLSNYVPVTPFRLLDTRNTGQGGPIGPGVSRPLQVTGVGSAPLPPSATAVVLNVTAVSGSASSLLSLYPYGTLRPNAANLNFAAHTVVGNLVTVTLGPHSGQGWVNIYNALGTVNVVVDVEGYFTPQPASDVTGLFHPVAPIRVCDTRTPSPTPICSAHGALGPGASMVVNFALTGGLPGDGTAEAAVVNVAGVAGTASTYLSLFPTNANGACVAPGTSTLNLAAGAVAVNRVMVELGPSTFGGVNDALCVFNAVGVINVIVDANGWYGSTSAVAVGYQYQAIAPTRICDTRFTSTSCSLGALGASVNRLITVGAHDGVPPNVSSPTTNVVAIIANMTGIAPTATTYLNLYPATLPLSRPTVSDLNLGPGAVLANLAVVELDTAADANQGDVELFNAVGSVNVTIDLEGWFQ
jgi:IPT/TIG domain